MSKWYVEHFMSFDIEAESEQAAIEIASDGGGQLVADEWTGQEIERSLVEFVEPPLLAEAEARQNDRD